jgi:glycosyltransferase involved in cell wall biosynthesis
MATLHGRAVPDLIPVGRLYPRWMRPRLPRAEAAGTGGGPLLSAWLPWTWRRAARHVERTRPDLVLIQWWHPVLGPAMRSVARAARAAGATVGFVAHNARPHEWFPAWRSLSRSALGQADVVFTLSQAVADQIDPMAPGARLEIVPHPPNLPVAAATAGPWAERLREARRPIVLFFGHVRRYKGLDDLIEAVGLLQRHAPATLVVAGSFFHSERRYRAAIRRRGLQEAVRLFPGYVPDEDLGELFALADVVALPYRTASQSGILPLALAAGKRVVATSVGGIPEALDGSGVLVPPRQPAALARGIERALVAPSPSPRAVGGWQLWEDRLLAVLGTRRDTDPVRSRTHAVVRVAAWVLIAAFVARVFAEGIGQLDGAGLRFAPLSLALSTALLALARVADIAGWHVLLIGTSARVPFRTSARLFTTAELVRFLPGGVLHLAARYRLASRAGIPKPAVVATTAVDLALRIAAAGILFVATLAAWPSLPAAVRWGAPLSAGIALAGLHPRLLGRAVARATRAVGRHDQATPIRPTATTAAAAIALGGWGARGLGLALLASSLLSVPGELSIPIAGAGAAAWVAGLVAPFAPGGLGIREAAGASILARFVALGPAVVLMVAWRIQSLAVEVASAWVSVGWDAAARRSGRAGAGPPSRPAPPEAERPDAAIHGAGR